MKHIHKKTKKPQIRKPNQVIYITISLLALSIPIAVIGFNLITTTLTNNHFSTLNTNGMKDNSDLLLTMDALTIYSASLESYNNTLIDNLVINELMADNDITIPGPDMNYPDWIELYNSGSESLDLSGLYLTDDFTNPTKWQFPNGTSIDSEDYLLIWGDGDTHNETLYASFQLNANGDSVAIFAKDAVTVIDSVTFKKQIRDTSYGRLPDGGSTWDYFSDPSPNWTNGDPVSDGEMPIWLLPVLIVLLVLVLVLAVIIKKIMIRREFK